MGAIRQKHIFIRIKQFCHGVGVNCFCKMKQRVRRKYIAFRKEHYKIKILLPVACDRPVCVALRRKGGLRARRFLFFIKRKKLDEKLRHEV